MRERLVALLAHWFTALACWVAPRPPYPPKERFAVELDPPAGKRTMQVTLLFLEGNVVGAGLHVAALLRPPEKDYALLVDAGVGRCWVQHVPREHADTLARRMPWVYRVEVWVNPEGDATHCTIGPVTCILLAKRLIGLDRPGVVTSRQLLACLWEMRHGRNRQDRNRDR